MTDTTPTTTHNAPVRSIDTLVLLFHPRFAQSATNRALADAAAAVQGVQVVDLAALYPEGRAIDGDAEVRRLLSARVLAFLDHLKQAFPNGTPDELSSYAGG